MLGLAGEFFCTSGETGRRRRRSFTAPHIRSLPKAILLLLVATCVLWSLRAVSLAQSGSLLVAYPLDQGTGNVLSDGSGNGNNGSVVGAVWSAGRFGSGLWFDGNTAYTIANPVRSFPTTALTAEFWVRTSDVLNQGTVISYAVSGSDNEFRVYDYNSLQISVKTTSATPATGVSVNDGLWHHVAVTWQSSDGRVQIYKDGALAFTGNIAVGAAITGGGALVLGQDQDFVGGGFEPAQACRGLLDEVRIYNRVLTRAEIQSDMGAPINATDTIPPTINNLAATAWRTAAVVTWTTTEPADSQVEYGLTPSYTSVSPLDATPVVSHGLTLNGLQTNTTYHYRVRSRDAAGNLTLSTDQTFTTLASAAPTGVKVAFLGDQGLGSNATAVLQLIRNEGAQAVVHLGDLDMADNPDAWDQQITSVLGPGFPYFAAIGDYDVPSWAGYRQKMQARLSQVPGASCSGDLGVQAVCTYHGLMLILTAPGVLGVGHDAYIRDQLGQSNFPWRISGWHANQQLMQVGEKTDEANWGVYEESRKGGAMVATAHSRSYSRTYLMSSFVNQTVASTASPLQLSPGQSFALVSGLGGNSIRPQVLSGAWWASIYTSTQGANFGALFCTFGINDQPNHASCYFKDISGRIPDQFEVLSTAGGATPPTVAITSPASGATVSGTITVSATASDSLGVAGVQFKVDGNNLGAEVTTAPYAVSLNTATLANGSHVLTAVARNLLGLTSTSAPVSVIVNNTVLVPPVISAVSAGGITSSGATITWTTDVPASSQVEYGLTTSYGASTLLDSTLVTGHTQALSGLAANTLYHYRVRSRGANGLEVISGDFTLTTRAAPVQFGHVVIVVEENHSYSSVIGSPEMPYLNGLADQYGLATNYFANTHPSIGNYFMLTAGQIITNDDAFNGTVTADNLVRQLVAAGKTWKSYAESLPSVGYTGGDVYPYSKHHNPFAYLSDVLNSPTQRNNLVPFSQFATDLAANNLPKYSFIVPNMLNDAHDGTLADADSWLQTNIAPLIANTVFQQDGLLVIVFDESHSSDTQHGGGQVPLVIVSPKAKPGFRSTSFYQHESTLRLMAQGVGLTSLPGAAATAADMSEFFLSGSGPVISSLRLSPTSVTGGVSSQGTVTLTSAAPSGGAVVALSSGNTAVASVPASVTVPAGATGATFTVTTSVVATLTTATISASYGGVTRTATLTVQNLIPRTGWSLKFVDSEELVGENDAAVNSFDGNANTIWHTQWFDASPPPPHEIQINLGAVYNVSGFQYLPRQDGCSNGWINQFEFYVSLDGVNWGTPVATGTFDYGTATKTCPGASVVPERQVTFAAKMGQYVWLRALSEVNGNPWTSMAELRVLQ